MKLHMLPSLLFAATVSAVDIKIYTSQSTNCNAATPFVACSNIAAGQCCVTPPSKFAGSAGAQGLTLLGGPVFDPGYHSLEALQIYSDGSGCNGSPVDVSIYLDLSPCLARGHGAGVTGASWYVAIGESLKRDESAIQSQSRSFLPDIAGLWDSKSNTMRLFSLDGASDDVVAQLHDAVEKGVDAGDLTDELKKREVTVKE